MSELTLHPDHVPLMQKSMIYSKSSLLPEAFRKSPEDCMIAMEIGGELGMSPLSSLQSLNVIKGKVSFPAETQMALMIQSRDYHWHTISSNQEIMDKGICTMKGARKSWPEGIVAETTYSVDEAQEAGLWQSNQTWRKHPADMLKHRCTTRFIQSYYPDVTKGVKSSEHMEDWEQHDRNALRQKLNPISPKPKMGEEEKMAFKRAMEAVAIPEPIEKTLQVHKEYNPGQETMGYHKPATEPRKPDSKEEKALEEALQAEAKEAGVTLWTKEELADMDPPAHDPDLIERDKPLIPVEVVPAALADKRATPKRKKMML